MLWLILSVSTIYGGRFSGYGDGGKSTLSVSTRGSTLGVDGVSCSITLVAVGMVLLCGGLGCYDTLGAV